MEDLASRTRNVDIEKMDPDQVETLGEQLGKKLGELGDAAAEQMNKITEIYGLKAKVLVQLFDAKTGEILKGK